MKKDLMVPARETAALELVLRVKDAYSQDIRQMAVWFKDHDLSLDSDGIKAWTKELQRRLKQNEISARSYNKKLSAIKNRLRLIFDRSTDRLDPVEVIRFKAMLADMKPIKIPVSETRVDEDKVLSVEQIDELRRAADPRLSLMIEFLRDTGCRISEMLYAGLGRMRRDGVEIQVVGKGKKMRTVTITKDLHKRSLGLFGGSTYLFEHNGRPYNRIAVTARIRALSGELWGTDGKVSAHALRHSFVTEALRRGVPIHAVADYVGHSSQDTTHRQYNHVVMDWRTTFKDLMKPQGV